MLLLGVVVSTAQISQAAALAMKADAGVFHKVAPKMAASNACRPARQHNALLDALKKKRKAVRSQS